MMAPDLLFDEFVRLGIPHVLADFPVTPRPAVVAEPLMNIVPAPLPSIGHESVYGFCEGHELAHPESFTMATISWFSDCHAAAWITPSD